jgi:hypothetical protein
VFGIWGADFILGHFGMEKLRPTFDRMGERVAKAIADSHGLHIQACDIYTPGVTPLERAGFDSATRYHTYAFGGNRVGQQELCEGHVLVAVVNGFPANEILLSIGARFDSGGGGDVADGERGATSR